MKLQCYAIDEYFDKGVNHRGLSSDCNSYKLGILRFGLKNCR